MACLRMSSTSEGGGGHGSVGGTRTVYTASAYLPLGMQVNYKYVVMRAPQWEAFKGNRILSVPPPPEQYKWHVQVGCYIICACETERERE